MKRFPKLGVLAGVAAVVATALLTMFTVGKAADGGWPAIPRKLPPQGTPLPAAERQKIEAAHAKVAARLKGLAQKADAAEFLPDVEIYEKAVRFALAEGEFYKPQDAGAALDLLKTAEKRMDELEAGRHPWSAQKGLVVRGYRSDVDGSAQPYGLEISDDVDLAKPVPLYVWLHGRGDTDTDLHFIRSREGHKGQIAPKGAIVLHPFGRQCLGFKSAGETDVLDAIASVQRRYKIDPDRVVLMGFSMGGAGTWHLAAHYADHFAAAHAGAGFVDVARYQHLKPEQYPAWYEQKLWGQYDVPDYVRNLFNIPFVAYGGEIDPQRASGEIMAETFKAEGHELQRLVGPKMPHKYDPASLAEIMKRMKAAADKGRDNFPKQVTLQTRTLKYHRMFWASIEGLGEHWADSRLDAEIADPGHVVVTTKNVTRFALDRPFGPKGTGGSVVEVKIDGKPVGVPSQEFQKAPVTFIKTNSGWAMAGSPDPAGALRKKPGLQGPIDDAFTEPFLVVLPTGKCASPDVQKWVDFEVRHFEDRWRGVFRGDLRVKKDTEVTADDIARYHLVLWGDAKANALVAKVLAGLPVKWTADTVSAGGKDHPAATHVPLVVYPNPLHPKRYVVLNSGPTFREESDKTNSLQNPKLPDWAVIDVTTPPDGKLPGKVADAGFFDEQWRFKDAPHGQ